MSLHYMSLDNSKNTNHKHISLTGTDHCNLKLSKLFSLKKIFIIFLIFQKSARKSKSKGYILEGLCVYFNTNQVSMNLF